MLKLETLKKFNRRLTNQVIWRRIGTENTEEAQNADINEFINLMRRYVKNDIKYKVIAFED